MISVKRAVTTAVACLLTATVAGCSTGELYGYKAPQDICGITVEPDTIKPFLPPGMELKNLPHVPGSTTSWGCNIKVDKNLVLQVASDRVGRGIDISDLAENGSLHLRNPKSATLEKTSQLQIAEDGALMEIPCAGHGESHLVTKVVIGSPEHRAKSTEDQSAEITAFLRSYVPELVKQKCDA
ncbi:hypothetical protein NEH83_14190 [Streptomyces sp. JUS-F4]|uniref:hypothetical protein n=1 Tax=Streptomyces TaxID=1883 RepID=UPI0011B0465D|nr:MULTISPECIES: hypothetical protein [Streptomyces]WKN15256.1 hypothetical protein NEH83_14190 [Streptomyces sp. JUS-F4]